MSVSINYFKNSSIMKKIILFLLLTVMAVAWVFAQDITVDPTTVTTVTDVATTPSVSWISKIGTWIGYIAMAIVPIEAILRLIPTASPAFSFLNMLLLILQKIVDVFHYIFPDNKTGGGRHLKPKV